MNGVSTTPFQGSFLHFNGEIPVPVCKDQWLGASHQKHINAVLLPSDFHEHSPWEFDGWCGADVGVDVDAVKNDPRSTCDGCT